MHISIIVSEMKAIGTSTVLQNLYNPNEYTTTNKYLVFYSRGLRNIKTPLHLVCVFFFKLNSFIVVLLKSFVSPRNHGEHGWSDT